MWEWVKDYLPFNLDFFFKFAFSKQALVFTCLQNKSFENNGGKEKLLIPSNFSFSYIVSYPFRELSAIFIKFKFVVCELFQFGRI